MTGRVLVVDDILANVKLLEARLSAEYFDVLTAYSGEEALERLRTERVDVVLLDVMMPAMDGFEVCRRIKGCAQDDARAGRDGDGARSDLRQGAGARSGRRRLHHQAGRRHRAHHPREEPGTPQDAERRDDAAHGDRCPDRRAAGRRLWRGRGRKAADAFSWSRTTSAWRSASSACSASCTRCTSSPICTARSAPGVTSPTICSSSA